MASRITNFIVTLMGRLVARRITRGAPPPIDPESLIVTPDDHMDRRFIALEGGVNFRDIGGYLTHDGQRVRYGLIYRSGTLARLTETDLERIQALNIRLFCDLRTWDEVQSAPDRLPAQAEYEHLPLYAPSETRARLQALLTNPSKLKSMVTNAYVKVLVEQNAPVYGHLLRRFSEPANLPALIHCTAGKDRTGVAIALLLALLGVPQDVISADYSQSNRYYPDFLATADEAIAPLMRFGVQSSDIQPLLLADPTHIRAIFDHIQARYGDVEGYLNTAAGVDDETIQRLRQNLLEPPP